MPANFKDATAGVNVRCIACSGSGNYRLDMLDHLVTNVIALIALQETVSSYFPNRKIEAIKELRGIYYDMGRGDIKLKTAKLLVDLVFDAQQNLDDIVLDTIE